MLLGEEQGVTIGRILPVRADGGWRRRYYLDYLYINVCKVLFGVHIVPTPIHITKFTTMLYDIDTDMTAETYRLQTIPNAV